MFLYKMGYDIMAYYDIDQQEIEDFIQQNNIDKGNQSKLICEYYKEKYFTETPNIDAIYSWEKKCQIHKLWDYFGVNFIRDDTRFGDIVYHRILEKKFSKPFPHCLSSLFYYLRTSEDAIEIADNLEFFFEDDYHLMGFSNWLRQTAKHNCIYKLSY